MSANPDSVDNQGEFRSKVPPSKPMTSSSHQIGQQVGNEAVHEFHAKTYPPGSAPKKDSFYPNPIHEIPGQANNPDMSDSLRTGALDIPGATSESIYQQSAESRPIEGQSSYELHHAGHSKHKRERAGPEGRGATVKLVDDTIEGRARHLGTDLPGNKERKFTERGIRAEERDLVTAEEL